jgi:phage shock protein PspC (stress-responsive transcriptional regulator)
MKFPKPSLLTRDDTILGVCEALGQDFGFNPFFLRAAIAASLLWNPVAILAGYVAAAVLIGIVRMIFPDPVPAEAAETAPAAAPAPALVEVEPEPLPVAA